MPPILEQTFSFLTVFPKGTTNRRKLFLCHPTEITYYLVISSNAILIEEIRPVIQYKKVMTGLVTSTNVIRRYETHDALP